MYGFNHDAAGAAQDKVKALLGRPMSVYLRLMVKTGEAAVEVATKTPDEAAYVESCQLPAQIGGIPVEHVDFKSIISGSPAQRPELKGATP
jgi:hypothetical protein